MAKYTISKETAWCPGCGNFGILSALGQALEELGIAKNKVLFVSGIGQAGKTPHYISGNVLNTLHGRTLPTATGAKLANEDLTVIAIGGDGDGFAEGGNHFLHALRKNVDITYLVHDNRVFGLTKGQASPSTDPGMVTGTTPDGVANEALNPLAMAITMNAGFVARGYSAQKELLVDILKKAITNPGFSFVDILQPCVTFNKINTYKWYNSRVYDLNERGYLPDDRQAAWQKAWEWGESIPLGVFYRTQRPTLAEQHPVLQEGSLVKQQFKSKTVQQIMDEYRV